MGKVTNMYDLYFADEKNDASIVPYMDGDYFPAEVENIIKELEDGKDGKKPSSQAKKKKGKDKKQKQKQKQKKKAGRGGTRSTGLDEEALKASGWNPKLEEKPLEEGGRDFVMVKLGETIQPMKESFIVAYLAWDGIKEDDLVVPKEIEEYREKHGVVADDDELKPEVAAEEATDTPDVTMEDATDETDKNPDPEAKPESTPDAEKSENDETKKDTEASAESNSKKDAESEEPTAMEGVVSSEDAKADEQAEPTEDVEPTQDPSNDDDSPAKDTDKDTTEDEHAKEESQPQSDDKTESKGDNDDPDKGSASDSPPEPMKASDSDEVVEKEDEGANDDAKDEEMKDADASEKETDASQGDAPSSAVEPPDAPSSSEAADPKSSDDPKPSEEKQSTPLVKREGKFAAMAARKRDLEGKVMSAAEEKEADKNKEADNDKKSEKEQKDESKTITVKDSKGRIVTVLDDDQEEMDCEFLNNRQAFLNLCQGNHYQFDFLRRAKHTSMMVLWHLHNRDAPKFVQQCATCSREILSGYRFHCPTCADFDQCQDCLRNPNIPRHPHPLKPMPVAGQQSELTEAQRKERQRSIQLHMTLLLHAATCNSSKCPSANCTKMKGLLKHGAQCQIKANGGCNVCKRIWALLQIHARQCKQPTCPVPNCMAIRERVRQLKKQQQAMDDRRRQEMNRHYRGARG